MTLPQLSGVHHGVFSAQYGEKKIFVKTAELLKNEIKVYEALEDLQGDTIPILIYHGWVHGCLTLILSDCGTTVEDLSDENLTEPIRQSCAAAVSSLHERGVLHGDLAERNMAVDRHGQVCIFDFGLSNRLILSLEAACSGRDAALTTVTPPAGR